jgi:tetratricopeptide (TPR) repeat protein
MTTHTTRGPAASFDISGYIQEGYQLLREGKTQAAVDKATRLADQHPCEPRIHAFAAEAYRMLGDIPSALVCIDKAIALSDNLQHRIKKAWLLSRQRRRDEIPPLAEEVARMAEAAPGDGTVFWQLGKLYSHHNQLQEAIELYQRALQCSDRPQWRYDLAAARFFSGDPDAAELDLEGVLAVGPQSGVAIYLRSVLRKWTPERNHVQDLQQRLQRGFGSAEDEACALYALAKELEDLGEDQASFVALQRGAQKKRSMLNYDVAAVVDILCDIREHTDVASLERIPRGCDEGGAIFIVGMPRTGTTLAERILLQSGKVKDAGELMDFNFQLTAAMQRVRQANPALSQTQAALKVDPVALGEAYMQGARQLAAGSSHFIDKMPVNYMYCGMIQKALPNARIIHLVRDPMDSCFAIFKTLFFQAYDFSYDLDELADYYIGYHRMMQHWREVMPGQILDVHYEDLVTDTETQARRIYAWCGLEWTTDALKVPNKGAIFATASAAQVRQPVHTRSINRWRRHAEALAPLRQKLVAAGVVEP